MEEQKQVQELEKHYILNKKLSASKAQYATYLAIPDFSDDWETDEIVIIKELDEKRAEIYKMLANMWNPYRASVYGVYSIGDKYAAVCEYIDGETLHEYMFNEKSNAFTSEDALNICIQICDALADIHKAGLIHKDLSPNNIMSEDDFKNISLIDFGLSTRMSFDVGGDTEMMGTQGFIAPEVIGITKTDIRADIYSIGCILNYIMTKKTPREGVLVQDPRLRRIVKKATAEDRRDRYQNIFKLKKALVTAKKERVYRKISFLKYVPGFRHYDKKRSFVAILVYLYLIRAFILSIWNNNIIEIIKLNLFLVIIPVAVIFDYGNIFRFFPHKLRADKGVIVLCKIILIVCSLLIASTMIYVKV